MADADPLLQQIKQALDSATPRPWVVTQGFLSPRHVVGNDRYILEPADQYPTRDADASLVAHAPEWLALLVERVTQAELDLAGLGKDYGTLLAESNKWEIEAKRLRAAIESALRETAMTYGDACGDGLDADAAHDMAMGVLTGILNEALAVPTSSGRADMTCTRGRIYAEKSRG